MFWQQTKTHLKEPGKLGPALALAHRGMEKYPSTKAGCRLAFWSGKIDELNHKTEQARHDYSFAAENFPSYYYGHRAKARPPLPASWRKTRPTGAGALSRSAK